jgi:glycosidase
MPNFSQLPGVPQPMIAGKLRLSCKWALLVRACVLLAIVSTASAQMLARPGWAGSGLNGDPWWKHAVFCDIGAGPDVDFKAITARLDALHSLGIDALILPAPAPPTQKSDTGLDSFDELVRQASVRDIRVVLTLPSTGASADISATARFWLSRGVAGFHLAPATTSPQDYLGLVESLRKITSSTVGERLVISDVISDATQDSAATTQSTSHANAKTAERAANSAGAQLQIDSRFSGLGQADAASIRPLLAESLGRNNVLLNFHAPDSKPNTPQNPAPAKALATILLATHTAALIDADEDLAQPEPAKSADSLPEWYRRLIALHHSNAALRSGNLTLLNFDPQNALVWVSRPTSANALTPPVVVACNLSSSPVQLPLAAAIKDLGLHGSFLRTLLRTDNAMGGQNLNSVTVPPFGVYIGELRR